MKHYIVVGNELLSAFDDTEHYYPVVSVEARNKREAKVKAIQSKKIWQWTLMKRENGQNPFSGLEVWDGKCEHGKCGCENCREQCDECLRELEEASNKKETEPRE